MPDIIERVSVGSHKEWRENPYHEGHGWNQIVTDYETIYHDCLVSKAWLKKHEHDLDGYEPSIELSVNGKTLSVNGNYKQGKIKEFMANYTTRARIGKKSVNLNVGIADKVVQ